MDGVADAEFNFATGEVVCNFVRVPDGPGQAVKLGNNEGVPGPARGEGFTESGAILVPAGKAMINIDPFRLNAEGCQSITLGGEVGVLVVTCPYVFRQGFGGIFFKVFWATVFGQR